jgi:hypothetical protein
MKSTKKQLKQKLEDLYFHCLTTRNLRIEFRGLYARGLYANENTCSELTNKMNKLEFKIYGRCFNAVGF